MSDQDEYGSVGDVVGDVVFQSGQDAAIKFHVYTTLDKCADADLTGWTVAWTCFVDETDAAAVLVKSGTVSGSDVTVALTAAEVTALGTTVTYKHQLLRTGAGTSYPLTGFCTLRVTQGPPLS